MRSSAPQIISLDANDRFTFSCHPRVPCFNQCCQDLHQVLTPEDILRLKQYLGLSSSAFLERFTRRHDGPETGLPVITLKPLQPNAPICPFVTPEGCRAYPARPVSCRLYPVARAVSRCRATGRLTQHYALIREPHCRGFENGPEWTVNTWIENQYAADLLALGDRMLSLIALKNQRKPGPLPLVDRQLFHLACYDMDGFRNAVYLKGMLKNFPVNAALLEKAQTDDWALLEIGYRYIGRTIFEQPASESDQ